jgi:hypothetical protein
MPPNQVIQSLLAAGTREAEEEQRGEARQAARLAWLRETFAAMIAAQERVGEAWDRIFDALPDDLDDEELEAMNLPDPPEQAEVDALYEQIEAARERDVWPESLYWGNV